MIADNVNAGYFFCFIVTEYGVRAVTDNIAENRGKFYIANLIE